MFHEDIKQLTKENTNFRKVLYTGDYSQLVLMCLRENEDIGEETHNTIDQIFVIVDGDGEAVVNGETFGFDEHDVIFVPAGTKHNIKNIGDDDLKLYTIYAPAAHPEGTIHPTKEDALNDEY